MSLPNGESGGIIPPSNTTGTNKTNNGIMASIHNPDNKPGNNPFGNFLSNPTDVNSSTNAENPMNPKNLPNTANLTDSREAPPRCDATDKDATASTIANRPKQKLKLPSIRKDLRLTSVFLVYNASRAPNFSIDSTLMQHTGLGKLFLIDTLAAGIVQGCTVHALRQYLDAFSRQEVGAAINGMVKGKHPVLFYAAERNCVECVKLLIEYGCDPRAKDKGGLPTIAFAIMRTLWTLLNPVEVVKILVAFGASPRSIPSDMWSDYLEPASIKPPKTDVNMSDPEASWCTAYLRKVLVSTLNLSIRYFLYQASKLNVAKRRELQIAHAHDVTALLKAPYLIIGQSYATKFVVNKVFSHIAMNCKNPLVLTFAGLSGHGKTELARRMGDLLQVPMTVVDCAQMRSDVGLFGSRSGYQGNDKGSQLNNHLTQNSGKRSVVFMDEFDKTDKEVHNSLLLVLDSGEYADRRTNKPVDASKTIWIMATNLGDAKIERFYEDNLDDLEYEERKQAEEKEGRSLIRELKGLFRTVFGAPMAGRMKNIAPFFPFSEDEQAVIVHKFLMELVDEVRQPIDLSPAVKRYPGHVNLTIKNDGRLCEQLANYYIQELGARSILSAIDDIRSEFFNSFVDTDEAVSEAMNEGMLMKYTVQLQAVPGGNSTESEVVVRKDGLSDYYKGQDLNEDNFDDWVADADMSKLSVS